MTAVLWETAEQGKGMKMMKKKKKTKKNNTQIELFSIVLIPF